MRALTPAEVTILKSRFLAGASGHRQKVVLTANVAAGHAALQDPYFPWVTRLASGNAGFLVKARVYGSPTGTFRVWFVRYLGQHSLADAVELFPYDTAAYGLVTYRGTLIAACYKPSDGSVVYRSSVNGGLTWSAEATLLAAGTYVDAEVYWASNTTAPAFQVTTDKAGTTLYIFTKASASGTLNYKSTTALDPTTGWTAKASTGLVIPSLGRNGGADGKRAFIACESKTPGTWVVACESDDGDWHANHMATQGTLGGAWTRKLNEGYGGGLSGGQGSNGGVFLDRNGDLLFYAIEDSGVSSRLWRSLDSGATWTNLGEQMPSGGQLGQGSGYAIPGYDFTEYIWGDVANTGVAIGVTACKPPAPVTNWTRILGTGAASTYLVFVPTTQDVSARVRAISTSKDDESDAAGFNIELDNTDGALNALDGAASLNAFAQPNVKVEVWQWHGVTANAVKTFTGWTDNVQENSTRQVTTLVGRDQAKKMMSNPNGVAPTAPQTLDKPGYVRDMGNFVYLNKTLAEVLNDLLAKAGLDSSATGRTWAASTYVFKELVFSSGTLMAAAKQAAAAAGMRFWFDEDGLARTAPVAGPQPASVWTFRAYEDLQSFDTDVSDDQTYTRVRIVGKANVGAKYLAEQFIWPGLGQPAGIEYDPLTGHVWYLDQNSNLYRLNPAANMAIVAGPYALGLGYPDGITVDPVDNHLWVSDGLNASTGNNAGRVYKKLDRANPTAAPLLGPFTNPDGDHCGIHAYDAGGGTVRLYMTTFVTGKLVRMNTNGTENSRVNSPVANPTAITSDGAGGYLLSGWDSVDLYQIDFAGNIVNAIKQPAKNGNELGYDSSDGGVYEVFGPQNTIVKYAIAGTPSGVETATYAEAVDDDLERQLYGEKRLLVVVDLNITDPAMALSSARRTLSRVRNYTRRTSAGAVGNPGLQLHDRVTASAPSQNVAAGDYMVRSIRADQQADAGTYLMVMVLEPYVATF